MWKIENQTVKKPERRHAIQKKIKSEGKLFVSQNS